MKTRIFVAIITKEGEQKKTFVFHKEELLYLNIVKYFKYLSKKSNIIYEVEGLLKDIENNNTNYNSTKLLWERITTYRSIDPDIEIDFGETGLKADINFETFEEKIT